MVETDLITAFYERLTGADAHGTPLTHGGSEVPVYTGNAPTGKDAPYVVIGRPRTRGKETIDGVTHPEVRLQLRAHTAYDPGKANHFAAYEIAQAAHDLLEAAPLSVGGKEPYVPEPDKDALPSYDKGEKEALDVTLSYTWPSL